MGYGWKQSEMWSGVTDVDRLPSLCIPLLTTSLRSVRLSALSSSLHIPFVPSLHVPSLITSSPIHLRPTGPSGLPSVRTVMGEVRIS